jgi:protein SCO1
VTSRRACGVRRAVVAVLAVVAATALAGCASEPDSGATTSGMVVRDDDGLHGSVLAEPYQVPPVSLTATDGSSYSLASDADRPLTLVFFGYTHCPDICQVVMADIASALTRLDDADRQQVGMQFVTTDPTRDDRGTLRGYLDRFDPEFGGLTGPLPRIVDLGEAMGVPVARGQRLPSGGYEVDHGTQVIGLLPDGTAPVVWTHGTSPDQIAEDIEEILADGVPDLKPETGGGS